MYIDAGISGIVSCDVDIGNGDTSDGGTVACIITLGAVSMVSLDDGSSFLIMGSVSASLSLRFRIVSPANFNCCCAKSSSSIIFAIASSSISSGSKSSGRSSSKPPFESLSLPVLFSKADDFLRSTSSALAD